jgi:hypothetical protein
LVSPSQVILQFPSQGIWENYTTYGMKDLIAYGRVVRLEKWVFSSPLTFRLD